MTGVEQVQLIEGKDVVVDVVLIDAPREKAFVEHEVWNGMIACAVHIAGVGGQNELCDDIDPNSDQKHQFQVREGLRSVVFGIDWDPELTTIPGILTFRFYRGDDWVSDTYEVLTGSPPLEAIIGPERGGDKAFMNIEDEWTLSFQVWSQTGGALSVSYQQQFTVWYDLYYLAEAPEDASALPE